MLSISHKELERKVEKLKHVKWAVMQPKIKKVITFFLYVNLVNKSYWIGEGRLKEGWA